MSDFFGDLLGDLRAKRLLAPAIGLLVGTLAVPVLLLRSPEPASAPPVAATPPDGAKPAIAVDPQPLAGTSRLDAFRAKDPFGASAIKAGAATAGAAAAGTAKVTSPSPATGTSPAVSPAAASVTPPRSSVTPPRSSVTPPRSGSTGSAPSSGSGSSPGATAPKPPSVTKSRYYTYTVDLLFGRSGSERRLRGVHRLDLVPNDRAPVLVFLGVTTSRRTAVFLVDSAFKESGEGTCRPSVRCVFLYLRLDRDRDQSTLTAADGTAYRLRLTGIDRVAVAKAKSSPKTRAAAARRSRWGFVAPAFADESG